MAKAKHITAFRSITNAGIDVSWSRFCKCNNASLSNANSTAIWTVFVLSAVNYQTVCNDLYLGSVQTSNCFFRRHNTADVSRSLLVAPLLIKNCNFVDFTDLKIMSLKNRLVMLSVVVASDQVSICIYIYIYIYTYTHSFIYIYIYIHTFIHTYVRTSIHTHIHTYIFTDIPHNTQEDPTDAVYHL